MTQTATKQLTVRGSATRARIVEAAASKVRARGAAGTSMDAVIAAAGVSKSQLYHYFSDKDALITAVVERQAERVLAANRMLLSDLSTLEQLRHWARALTDTATPQDGGCPLGSLVGELAARPQQRAALEAGFACWRGYLAAGFKRMVDRGEISANADPETLSTMCLAALQGGLLLSQVEKSSRPLALALEMAVAQVASYARGDARP